MHTKSHPQNVKFLRLWLTDAFDPAAHRRVALDVRVTAMYWGEGVRSPQPMKWAVASPTPLRRHGLLSNHGSFVWREQEFRSIPVIPE